MVRLGLFCYNFSYLSRSLMPMSVNWVAPDWDLEGSSTDWATAPRHPVDCPDGRLSNMTGIRTQWVKERSQSNVFTWCWCLTTSLQLLRRVSESRKLLSDVTLWRYCDGIVSYSSSKFSTSSRGEGSDQEVELCRETCPRRRFEAGIKSRSSRPIRRW